MGSSVDDVVEEGELLWTPSIDFVQDSGVTRFMNWLREVRGRDFGTYEELWNWSVDSQADFWRSVWDYFGIVADGSPEPVLSGDTMFDARWFESTRLNYAEHLLRHEAFARPDEIAISHSSELRPPAEMRWTELGAAVRRLATSLRDLGIEPGDRIVSYMPNVPETVIAMIATVSIGAIWSSAAPEFGPRSVIERFSQIAPKLIFAGDGYSFNGRRFDRRGEVSSIVASLPSLQNVVFLSYLGLPQDIETPLPVTAFDDLLEGPPIDPATFKYERMPWDSVIWILFSSGTTGLPKAIAHSHHGMTLEHLKVMTFHCNLAPGKRMFFYSTTGWMMWNSVVASLICGATAVLYDGSPVYEGVDKLWRIASQSKASIFGASPTLVQTMKKAGVRPRETHDLTALDTVILGGAPSTPETFKWFYDEVATDLWVTSQSGGTEICSGLVGGVPTLPVYAGEIQARLLGMAVDVWNEAGETLVDTVGELVVTRAMPSAPLTFWGEDGSARYHESYYGVFPGVWRHGDLAKINSRGGVYIYGRSDSTLNRHGVRIGTAEIYKIVEQIPEVADALVVCCETPSGGFYMPMFVTPRDGSEINEVAKASIERLLRNDASPRHVPDEIVEAPAIPYTLTGKKMEVPIRKLLMGVAPEKAASRDAMVNPALLEWYVEFAERRQQSDSGQPA